MEEPYIKIIDIFEKTQRGSLKWLKDELNECMNNCNSKIAEKNAYYEQGMDAAWEAAFQIIKMTPHERNVCMGTRDLYDIFSNHYAAEAINKIHKYGQQFGDLKQGDEVIWIDTNNDGEKYKAVVIDMHTEDDPVILTENGCIEEVSCDDCTKTGHTYPIPEIIRQLQEGE